MTKRISKILLEIVATISLTVILLPIVVSVLLQIPALQNILISKVTSLVENKLGVDVGLKKVRLAKYNEIVIEGLYVESPHKKGDTLIYVDNFRGQIKDIDIENQQFDVRYAKITGGKIGLYSDSLKNINFKLLVDKIRNKERKRDVKFGLNINNIELDSFALRYETAIKRNFSYGVDYDDIQLNDISIHANNFELLRDSINIEIERLSLQERCGVRVDKFSTDNLIVSPSTISAGKSFFDIDDSEFNVSSFSLHYNEWQMNDFINEVVMRCDIDSSYFDMSTIEKFSTKRRNWGSRVALSGKVEGVVSDMNCQIDKLSLYNTYINSSSLRLNGLPNIKETNFLLNLSELTTNYNDLTRIVKDFTGKPLTNKTLEKVGAIVLKGKFDGTLSEFRSSGNIFTDSGNSAFMVKNDLANDGYNIKGAIVAKNINGERIFGVESLKDINLDGRIDSYIGIDSTNVEVDSKIDSALYRGYKYRDIEVNGLFTKDQFIGNIKARDPNLNFDFNGLINIKDKIPYYDFDVDIAMAELNALKFNKRDSISLFSGNIRALGSGTKLDNMNGNIEFENFYYVNPLDTVEIGKIKISTTNSKENKRLTLTSDFADINISAQQSYSNIAPYLIHTISKYLPSLRSNPKELSKYVGNYNYDLLEKAENNYYFATLNVKEANNMASIFVPGLNISKGSKLSFLFNPASDEFSFTANSSNITKGDFWINNLNISSHSFADSISIYSAAKELNIGAIYLPNIEIIGGVKDDNVELSTRFDNKNDNSGGLLALNAMFSRKKEDNSLQLISQILPSFVAVSGQKWMVNSSKISIDSSRVNVDNFSIVSNRQKFRANGVISKFSGDTLSVDMNNFRIGDFSIFTHKLGYDFEGQMSGNTKIYRRNGLYNFAANLDIDSLTLNEYKLPNLKIMSNEVDSSSISYSIWADKEKIIDSKVDFKTKKFEADVKVNNLNLEPLSPLLKVIGHDCEGRGDIDVTLDNYDRPLRVNGDVNINNFATTIDFTNVRYNINGKATIRDNIYTLVDTKVTDPYGVKADMSGSLDGGDRYSRVKYNIGIKPDGLLCLNTTLDNNPLFYGNIKGSGSLKVNGHGTKVEMLIDARTVDNSKFFMPLSNKSTIDEVDFITFIKPKGSEDESIKRELINLKSKKRNTTTSQFTMDINVSVANDTEVQLVIDPTLGDIIKAKGRGELRMQIDPNRDKFEILGGYEISEGSYLFTLANFKLINKYFVIKPGSTINWNGDPLAANLNVTAVYQTKTSLAPLLGAMYNRRVDVDCNLMLAGKLMKPDITLGITVPDVDPETRNLVSSYLNTEESISKQIFWLLFSNSFYADTNNSGTNVTVGMVGTAGAVTGIEFLSNQISNWISNDKFDLGFNYLPRSEITSDELELNFSAPLLNNRLLIEAEGNYDFKNNTTYLTGNSKTLSGNFYITYLLDKKGKLQTKAFTRQIDSFDENQGLQESGVGIYYSDSFDKFEDLFRRYKEALNNLFKSKKSKK